MLSDEQPVRVGFGNIRVWRQSRIGTLILIVAVHPALFIGISTHSISRGPVSTHISGFSKLHFETEVSYICEDYVV